MFSKVKSILSDIWEVLKNTNKIRMNGNRGALFSQEQCVTKFYEENGAIKSHENDVIITHTGEKI